MTNQPSIDNTTALAEFWGVSRRTIQVWIREKFWVPNTIEMAERIQRKPKVSPSARQKAQEILIGQESSAGGSDDIFPRAAAQQQQGRGYDLTQMDRLEGMTVRKYRDTISKWLFAAYERNDKTEVQRLESSLFKANEILMKEEAHLKKMGLDNLEVIDREALGKLLYMLAWAIVRGVDSTASKLSKSCLKRDFPEEIYNEAHPILMNAHYAIPLLSMMSYADSVGFPGFVIDELKSAFAEFHERGIEVAEDYERVFSDLLAMQDR